MFHKEDLINVKDTLKESWKFGQKNHKIERFAYAAVASYVLVSSIVINAQEGIQPQVTQQETVSVNGWQDFEGNKVYLDQSGTKLTGLQNIEQGIYFFDENGFLQLGWQSIMGKTFYFDSTGKMATGETVIDGKTYNIKQDGTLLTGWQPTAVGTCYYNECGYPSIGMISIENNNYYFDQNGILQKGWITVDNKIYYAGEDGKIATADVKILDKIYHFAADGTLIAGWFEQNGNCYYKKAEGTLAVGAQKIDGVDYLFTNDGILVRNQTVGMYTYDMNGICTRDPITVDNLDAALDEIIKQTGTDITSIASYVKSHLRYKYRDRMSTREEMAVYALNNKSVSCYYYAALTGLLLEKAGYETITVEGKGFVYAEHNWNLVKTTRNGVEGWYHVDSLKGQYIKTDAEMVAKKFVWPHEKYPATP